LVEDGVVATVYSRSGTLQIEDEWGAIWNGAADGKPRRLKGKYPSADEAISAVETAITEGERSPRWWPPECEWRETKKGGYYRKHNGATISVKQAKSGSWYAINMHGALLGQFGRSTWFGTPAEARDAVDAVTRGSSAWTWIARSEDAA
jgi:hypothetical protein